MKALVCLDCLGKDDPAIGDDGEHVGKVVEVDLHTGRIALRIRSRRCRNLFRQLSTAAALSSRTALSNRRS
jgi:hypothetical protein